MENKYFLDMSLECYPDCNTYFIVYSPCVGIYIIVFIGTFIDDVSFVYFLQTKREPVLLCFNDTSEVYVQCLLFGFIV